MECLLTTFLSAHELEKTSGVTKSTSDGTASQTEFSHAFSKTAKQNLRQKAMVEDCRCRFLVQYASHPYHEVSSALMCLII